MDGSSGKRVCVIGAGIAGLVTSKVLKEDGFEVVVFEKQPEPGGVWASSRTYPGLRTNNPRETYAFSDYPYPESSDDFPSAEQVRSYLGSYTEHFGLRPLIRFSTEVLSVVGVANGTGEARTFKVVSRTEGSKAAETLLFDYLVICNGVFSTPKIPHVVGQELFEGTVFHSSRLTDPGAVEGKRVVVVGAGKSALDCAAWAAEHGESCTLVFRSPHWMAPRYFFGRIRFDRMVMTRSAESFLRYHRMSRCERVLHGPAGPFVRAWWRGYGCLLKRLLKMPPVLTPELRLPLGFEYLGVGGEMYKVLDSGKLVLKRAGLSRFTDADEIELDTGEAVKADVVVFATGYRLDLSFLEPGLLSQVQRNSQLRLYRHILPPRQSRIGFIGYASSTACQLTSEVAAHWLSQCFRGELALPSAAEIEKEISRVLHWASETFPGRGEGYYIGPFVAHYLDDLMGDMGLPRRRTGGFFTEYFAPFWPDRYRNVGEERRRLRAGKQHHP
ncbi:MAG TPA: NAD(P)/FAD-dependent oxidoreductase [Nitrospirota bacterium]